MSAKSRRMLPSAAAAILAALSLAACSSGGTAPSGGSASPSSSVNPAWEKIRSMLPASVRQSGTLTVGTSPAYPPFDYYDTDNKTIIGIDPELAAAASEVLGVKMKFVAGDFSTLIPGLAAGRYDLVWADAGDNATREKQVDIIDYDRNQSTFLTASSEPPVTKMTDVCGKTMAIEQGATEVQYMQKQTADCTSAGLPAVQVQTYPSLDSAVLAVKSGRAYATVANSATIGFTAKQSNGTLTAGGPSYFSTLTGVLTPKGSALTQPLQEAIQAVLDEGTYAKVLAKYGASSSAVDKITVNGATTATTSATPTKS